jgi:hypothetical protein
LIVRRLIVPLTMAIIAVHAIEARARSALPGAAAPPSNDQPVNEAAPSAVIGGAPSALASAVAAPVSGGFAPSQQQAGPSGGEECTNGFLPLRREAEKRGAMIKTASERHAAPDEACKLLSAYAHSELKLIKYIEAQQPKCGIPPEVGDQLKSGHKNTENMLKKVCDAARQAGTGRFPLDRCAGVVVGSDGCEEKWGHDVRYAERQRAVPMSSNP